MTLIWLAVACGDTVEPHFDTAPYDTDTYVEWPDDSGETGTDEDGDGWTVEEGDCDDDDIHVNPARDEDPTDGKDNDCDGRVDEVFAGLAMVFLSSDGSNHRVETVDQVGRRTATIEIDDPGLAPYFFTSGAEGSGYAIVDLAALSLVEISDQGTTSLLAEWPEAEFGVMGLTTHPDGYYLATTVNSLVRVDPDGTTTTLASWDAEVDLYAFDVAVDVESGDIAVFGYTGAFGIYHPDGSWELLKILDFYYPTEILYSGAHRDNGGWYAGGGDTETGDYGRYLWDSAWGGWSVGAGWDQDWDPHFMTVEGGSGDFYVTTAGGQYPYVWRVLADGSQTATFYPEPGTHQPGAAIWDLYVLYR